MTTSKITRDVLESYLHCKYKGHLKLSGQQGVQADFEALQSRRGQECGSPPSKRFSQKPPSEVAKTSP